MSPEAGESGRSLTPLLVGLALLGLLLGLVVAFVHARLERPSLPDGVSATALLRAFDADPSLPLDPDLTDVVLVEVCTFRRDRLQPHGVTRPSSPFLARLATHGLLFERLIVQAPWTRPSVASIETGLYPAALHLDDPSDAMFSDLALSEAHVTLAELFRARGFRTLAASSNPNVNRAFGFAQGFEIHDEPEGLWRDMRESPPTAATLVRRALTMVDSLPRTDRFFLRLFLVDLHAPRYPSPASLRLLTRAFEEELPESDATRLIEYEATLRDLDAQLARLLCALRARRPNLLFLVIGDHGEGLSFPQHHGLGHGNYLYRSVTEVPFLVHHPALPQPGRRVGGLTTGLDLVPTLAELFRLEPPSPLDGSSLVPQLLGRERRIERRYAFSETWFRKSRKTCVYDERYHLIRDHRTLVEGRPAEELYFVGDRLELSDVRARHPDAVLRLREALDAWEAEMARLAESGQGVQAGVSEGEWERLRGLGYVE